MKHRALARMLGGDNTPGLPSGIYIEVLGKASAGKTTLVFALIEAVVNQAVGTMHRVRTDKGIESVPAARRALFFDFEHTLDLDYLHGAIPGAVVLNVSDTGEMLNRDKANIWIHQPDVLEEGLEVAAQLVMSGGFDLLVIDSVPAMLPMAVRDRPMDEPTVGKHAAAMAVFFQRLTAVIAQKNVTVVLINQWRDVIPKPGQRVMPWERRSPGGKSMEYFDSIKLDVAGAKKTRWFEHGKTMTVKSIKNKVTGVDGQVVTYHIGVGYGASPEVELTEALLRGGFLDLGAKRPVTLLQGTAHERSFPTPAAWLEFLRTHPKSFQILAAHCNKHGVEIGEFTVYENEGLGS